MKRSQQNTISCLLYVFRWKPGRNSALLANLHRPDVCLPASGWTQVADDGVRNYPVTGAFELPFRHFEFQRAFGDSPPQTAHAFYCLSEDRAAGLLHFRRSLGKGSQARTRPGCQEAAPNGRAPNVFARFWKGAVTWDSRSSKQYSSAASRSPQRMRNRICAIWFVMCRIARRRKKGRARLTGAPKGSQGGSSCPEDDAS